MENIFSSTKLEVVDFDNKSLVSGVSHTNGCGIPQDVLQK